MNTIADLIEYHSARAADERKDALDTLRMVREELAELERALQQYQPDHRDTPTGRGVAHRTQQLMQGLAGLAEANATVTGLAMASIATGGAQ